MTASETYRTNASPLALLRSAIGGPAEVRGKIERAERTFRSWRDREELRRRLQCLKERGYIEKLPTLPQLAVGALDTFRYFLIPGSDDFYRQNDINFTFHQILRWLDDPVSMLDPVGLLSDRDVIIGHVLQVTHHDPIYDLQLLQMFPDGLEEMERQTEQAIAGTHPRSKTLRATIEDAGYYQVLLEKIRTFRANPHIDRLAQEEFFRFKGKNFERAERTFSTLPGLLAYCARMPKDPAWLVRHVLFDRVIPPELAAPES